MVLVVLCCGAVLLLVDKLNKLNDEEGGLSPNCSGNSNIIRQKTGSWVQLGVHNRTMVPTHFRSGK